MGVLDDSWRFARKFNADRDLRMKLWKVGMFVFDSVITCLGERGATRNGE